MDTAEAAGLMGILWIIALLVAAVSGAARGVIDVAEDAPTPAPTPTPAPVPETSVNAFLAGYRAGGGDPAWEQHLVDDVISCESEWSLDPSGYHYGLAQFSPDTWRSAKCRPEADYRSPWEQGCAVASWMAAIPGRWGTTAGWPVCWWRGL